jgi:flagellar basal-body rod modification protein FlgD
VPIDSIGQQPSATPAGAAGGTGIAADFTNFLKLLTTQLANQDPLSPMDPNQFTEQLVLFSGVEQSLRTNDLLGRMIGLMEAGEAARALDFIGARVEAEGDVLSLGPEGGLDFRYEVKGEPAAVVARVLDMQGRIAWQEARPPQAGPQELSWDGHGPDGVRQPEGRYRLEVVAENAAGERLGTRTWINGLVEAVERLKGGLMLVVGGQSVPIDAITRVQREQTA